MTLKELIDALSERPSDATVLHGFGKGHSDRGDYCDAAFEPVAVTTFGEMLGHARALLGTTQTGWKGGEFEMHEYTKVHIGHYGRCGEEINGYTFLYWDAVATGDDNHER